MNFFLKRIFLLQGILHYYATQYTFFNRKKEIHLFTEIFSLEILISFLKQAEKKKKISPEYIEKGRK
jgi:hypothetical protein